MRDKIFYINAIKMDLYRVVTATGDITKEIPRQSVLEFLDHANRIFNKIELDEREEDIKTRLIELSEEVDSLKDPHERLRWAENILTLRCRI